MARQFIYHMQGLTKTYTGGKKVLDNVHLQFYPDAKIGVLGPNGAGKSSLLKIMAVSTRNGRAKPGSPRVPKLATSSRNRSLMKIRPYVKT